MLSNVSWEMYLVAVVILLLVYYVVTALIFYRKEAIGLLTKKAKPQQPAEAAPAGIEGDAFDELEMVVHDIRYAVLENAEMPISKAQLLVLLQQRLKDYSGIDKPAYRHAINNYIIVHAQEICGVAFSEDELNAAWDGQPRD